MAMNTKTDKDYILYNRDRKIGYVDVKTMEVGSTRNHFFNLFQKANRYEKQLGKDLCDFSASDITSMYRSLNVSNEDVLIAINSVYGSYVDWCLQHGMVVDNQNHYREVTAKVIRTCVNKNLVKEKLITRAEVLRQKKRILNVCDYFMLLAVFEGISGKDMKDLSALKLSDFENKGGQWYAHLSSGRTVMASDRLYVTAREANAQTFYTAEDRIHDRDLIPHNGAIIKYRPEQRVFTDTAKRGRVMKGMKHVFSEISNAKMTVTYLKDSGKIYFLRQKAKKEGFSSVGDMLSIENRSKVDFSDIENQYGAKFSISKFLNKYQSVCDTLEDEF